MSGQAARFYFKLDSQILKAVTNEINIEHVSWGRIPRAIDLGVPGKSQNFNNKIKIAVTNEQHLPDTSTAHPSFYVHFEGSPPRRLRHDSLGNALGR